MKNLTVSMLVLGLIPSLVACESDIRAGFDSGPTPPGSDAGTGGVDAGPPLGVDAATPNDAGPGVPGADAGPGGGGTDAGPGGGGMDAGPGGGMRHRGLRSRAGYVGCGEGPSCMSPQVCCVGLSGAMCTGSDGCGGSLSAAGTCDGPEDCGSGQSCCVHFGMFDPMNGAFCRDGGSCPSGDNQLCHSSADCAGGETCVACSPPTGGVLDVTYGICSASGTCPSPYTPAS